ncbi:PREDICTED: mitochondrial inner membrane protease subunit 2-like [Miniopterus natalensis]|uniref:mitochondrial inner membrane protease subunit 2-like n=1 Tax=Miniopterus natalensis TaxID=291302 RepID=UPI0007A6E795|nr:PREDICTED: mitochondrial inner membrane protease subunit 2-like [Miniopterus natalensis]
MGSETPEHVFLWACFSREPLLFCTRRLNLRTGWWPVPEVTLKGARGQCLRSPKNPGQKIIKRVIALEGDIVKTMGHKNRYVKVPRGHIWVEGDHHGHSFDSNSFGPVSLGLLHAHATHILWPPERWQKLQSVLPPERLPVQRED